MLPLVYLGAGLAALYAGNRLSEEYQKQQGTVGEFPGDSQLTAVPVEGAVVCCGIYQVLDHTGIWLDDGIVEMNGSGLVRCISPLRFTNNRSGRAMYVACNSAGEVLVEQAAAMRAASRLFEVSDYHLFKNNCHRFVAEALLNKPVNLTSFADLNALLADYFSTRIHWLTAHCSP